MPVKIARSTPRASFGLRELLVASHISRLASRDAAKSLLSTLVSESSGECRLIMVLLTSPTAPPTLPGSRGGNLGMTGTATDGSGPWVCAGVAVQKPGAFLP